MEQGNILARLAELQIHTTEAEQALSLQEFGGFIQGASIGELSVFVQDMTAFAQRVGGLSLDAQAALAGDPVEKLRAAAIGYYLSALLKAYQYQRLQQDEAQAGE